ncbi:nSTAND1 domain-containing NTPase [Leptothoe sp. PORK10 BA2]|uniref:nSTAND1 domain-containing NTPase n=1 Tax=Leptothoe sp. PORK10 BA2 TaxID=3110254 RepID=UPI002B1F76EB|nr:TIR domain-containing protein [Leptothoe sp. PORK10 BA2]MEA5464065.1 TIR domain-containing protein [Leptothoe sp. PORK10 BA2]
MADFDLFISYAEANRAWVEGYLLDSLDQADVSYLSEEAFALGAPRLQEFERAIQRSQRTLLVLSPAYVADSFNQFVDLLAQCFGLDTSTWPVIPLLLEPVQLPPRLAALVRLDATDPERWESAISRLCRDLEHEAPSRVRLPDCPYPGMLPFSEANSDRFFGRDQEIEELLERLRLSRFITVIGPSGSGKSSLVLAGLVPALRQSNTFGNGTWLVKTLRPGIALLAVLKEALETDDLQNSNQIVSQLLASHSETQRLLLIVDQFEEIFTPSADTLTSSEIQDRLTFQQALLSLMDVANCYIVLTVRADFYADLMASSLWRSIRTHRMEITPLDEQGLRSAIVQPAEKVGVFVESALAERLVTDAAGEPGILPLVQETLVLLWSRVERRYLPLRAYEALVLPRKAYGPTTAAVPQTGLQVAIARRADAAVGSLSNDQQEVIARRIFLRLIHFGEGRADTRRQQPVKALHVTGENSYEFDQTLFHLVDNRLLTLNGEEEAERKVDIAHEALISGWPLLQQWIGERREAEQTRRRLTAKAEDWVRLGKEAGGLLDAVELLEAERWLESTDAEELGYDSVLTELVVASRNALEEAERQQEEAQQRELTLIREALEQERKATEQERRARKAAQTRNTIATTFSVLLAGLTMLALFLSRTARIRTIEASMVASESLFVANKDIEALTELIGTGRLLQQPFLPMPGIKTRYELHFAKLLVQLREQNRFKAHDNWVLSVDVSPDGQTIATASSDNTVKLWQFNGEPLQSLTEHQDTVVTVTFSPNGQTLASASLDNTIRLWQRQSDGKFNLKNTIQELNWMTAITFSPDGKILAAAGADGTIKFWDLAGNALTTFSGHEDQVMSVAFSDDGERLASGSEDGTVKLWNVQNGELVRTLQANSQVLGVRFVGNERIVAAKEDAIIQIWDTEGNSENTLQGHSDSVLYLNVSPDGETLASAGQDGMINIWDLTYGTLLQTLEGHDASVSEVSFSPDGQALVSTSQDGTVRVWDLDGVLPVLEGSTVSFSPDGQMVASGNEAGEINLWMPDGELIRTFQAHEAEVIKVRFHPDGKLIASIGGDGLVKLWNIDGALNGVLEGHTDSVYGIDFSFRDDLIATASGDGTIKVWDLEGKVRQTLEGHKGSIQEVSFSPDGKIIASAGEDGTIKFWNTAGNLLRSIEAHKDTVFDISFSPNGKLIASGSGDQTVKVWELNGDNLFVLERHSDTISSVRFSANSKYIVSASYDKTVRISNMKGEEQEVLLGSRDIIFDIDLDQKSKLVAAASFDQRIILWNKDLKNLLNLSCNWVKLYFLQANNIENTLKSQCSN